MLTDKLTNQSLNEIKNYCINELKAISYIVDAHGNKTNAGNSLRTPELGLNETYINKLLALFENRKGGVRAQNINRTAAKYVEALKQILKTLDEGSYATVFSTSEQQNLNRIRVN